jgi:hypothetical protein
MLRWFEVEKTPSFTWLAKTLGVSSTPPWLRGANRNRRHEKLPENCTARESDPGLLSAPRLLKDAYILPGTGTSQARAERRHHGTEVTGKSRRNGRRRIYRFLTDRSKCDQGKIYLRLTRLRPRRVPPREGGGVKLQLPVNKKQYSKIIFSNPGQLNKKRSK